MCDISKELRHEISVAVEIPSKIRQYFYWLLLLSRIDGDAPLPLVFSGGVWIVREQANSNLSEAARQGIRKQAFAATVHRRHLSSKLLLTPLLEEKVYLHVYETLRWQSRIQDLER